MPVYHITRFRPQGHSTLRNGFTLVELLIVLALVSIMLAVSAPSFRTTLFSDPLKQAARQITATVREARQQAVTSEQGCFLSIFIEERKLELSCPRLPAVPDGNSEEEIDTQNIIEKDAPDAAIILAGQVKIVSVWNGAGQRIASDVVRLWINVRGLMEPAIINIQNGEAVIGLSFSPFLPGVRMSDELIVPGDAGQVPL